MLSSTTDKTGLFNFTGMTDQMAACSKIPAGRWCSEGISTKSANEPETDFQSKSRRRFSGSTLRYTDMALGLRRPSVAQRNGGL